MYYQSPQDKYQDLIKELKNLIHDFHRDIFIIKATYQQELEAIKKYLNDKNSLDKH